MLCLSFTSFWGNKTIQQNRNVFGTCILLSICFLFHRTMTSSIVLLLHMAVSLHYGTYGVVCATLYWEKEIEGVWGEICKCWGALDHLSYVLHIDSSQGSTPIWSALHKPIQSNPASEEKKSIRFSVIGLTVHSKVQQQSILKMKNEARGHLSLLICTERMGGSRYRHIGI